MRFQTSLLATSLLAGSVLAQAQTQEYDNHYGGTTSYTTRGGIGGTIDGFITQMVPAGFNRAVAGMKIGGVNTTRINGARCVNQDQDSTTQEVFTVGIFLDNTAIPGEPDPNPTGTPPVPTYVLSFGTGTTPANTGIRAWIWTFTLGTPADGVVPVDQNWYMAHSLPSNALWVNDGLSVHGANMSAATGFLMGEFPSAASVAAGLPNHVHTMDPSGGTTVVSGSNNRAMRVWPTTEAVVLEIGADIDPNQSTGRVSTGAPFYPRNYGTAGWFPDHAVRGDGLAFKMEQKNLPSALGAILMSFPAGGPDGWALGGTPLDPLIPVFPQSNGFWIDVVGFSTLGVVFSATLDTAGLFEGAVIPFGPVRGPFGDITAQGVVIDAASNFTLNFSNAVKLRSL